MSIEKRQKMHRGNKDEHLRSTPIKGSNQITVGSFNERLVLHLVRRYGTLTKAEATRATGLSPNAASMIFKALETDNLLLRCDPIRGRVGQPSVPMRINPAARHYLGLKIGRRSFDMVVIDFSGNVVARRQGQHDYPTLESTIDFVKSAMRPLLRSAKIYKDDISGLGVAMPWELWHWTKELGVPSDVMDEWRNVDIGAELTQVFSGPISVENDGTAACRAELVFGAHNKLEDFIYLFVGTFIGGGVVLNGGVFTGSRGNSGGFGPLRITDEPGGQRLVDHASLIVLERQLDDAKRKIVQDESSDWDALEPLLSQWISRVARSLAQAIVSSLAVIDFEAAVIDGAFPKSVRSRIIAQLCEELGRQDLQGVLRPEILEGQFGDVSRALGAAAFRIASEFMIDQNTLMRESPGIAS
ncbi:ROK family transcriptional regulator [Thioclava sp. NG1]|uniref:ROK family transcriptional regulator n=1 Tax=Thioclava sp. NG1 TaxID=2182426 RepID=UPI0011B28697|nr:ROK family protein [Thioclava sp. NG1]